MKRLWPLLLCIAALTLTPDTRLVEAEEFKKAPEGCSNAHAVLGWSQFKQGKEESDDAFERRKKRPWYKLGLVVGRLNWANICDKEKAPLLEVVSSHEPGKIQQASFKQYSVKGHDGAYAYVAHCGHGGTCNMVASRLHALYKGIGKPRVYCGENAIPNMLESPTSPTLELPSCEDLSEGDDDDLDFGDDDDDDDDDKLEDQF
jgi:hypothetical protein